MITNVAHISVLLDSVCQMAFPNPGTMYKGRLTHLTVPEGDCMGRGHQLP